MPNLFVGSLIMRDDDSSNLLITLTISIDRDGNVRHDTQTHGNTFAEAYRGFVGIKGEIDRQINERRNCPYNPISKTLPDFSN